MKTYKQLLNEINIKKIRTPNGMIDTFYSDLLPIINNGYKLNRKEKPFRITEIDFESGDQVVFVDCGNTLDLFKKYNKVGIGEIINTDDSTDTYIKIIKTFNKENNNKNLTFKEEIIINHNFNLEPENTLNSCRLIIKGFLVENKIKLLLPQELEDVIKRWFISNAIRGNPDLFKSDQDTTERNKKEIHRLASINYQKWFQNKFPIDSSL
jgi:hypothetical protein